MAAAKQGHSDQTDGTLPSSSPSGPRFYYGGQAVIEGVMIRGRRFVCVAARRPSGQLATKVSTLSSIYTGVVRRIPLIRGVFVLAETLMLGTRSLIYSANVSLEQEGKELGRWSTGIMLAISLGFVITVFFLFPLFVVQIFDRQVTSDILSNLVEGVVRMAMFLAYICGIGFLPDIRRVFAYHGAEHMTVKAYEANDPLEIDRIRQYSTAHPRCGTAFLLVVMVVAILVFAFLGRPPMFLRILSRVIFVPVIAGLAYEVIRFSGAHQDNPLIRQITAPSLLLQKLTTRQPEDAQIEVAIHAMNTVLAADEGREQPREENALENDEEPSTE